MLGNRRDNRKRPRVLRRLAGRAAGLLLLILAGCNQNPSGAYTPSWPWAAGAGGRQSYFDFLRRQAQAQSHLASEQQRRLAELESMQRQNDQHLALLRQQEQQEKLKALQEQQQQQALLAQRAREALGRYDDLGQRARVLDQTNQDLHTQMARMQQRAQLLEDQNQLLRQRLDDTSRQLASALQASQQQEQRLQAMMASTQRRSGATITANNSYRRHLTAVTVAGLSVRQDGELVRIELPSDRLFMPQSADFRPDAAALIDQVASVIVRHYPRQVIGIEAHTDAMPLEATVWRNAHQLTSAQAMAVFEQLSYRHRLLPQQMFVLGHGSNFALASNATDAGRARNRRVEVVIYPETVGQQ